MTAKKTMESKLAKGRPSTWAPQDVLKLRRFAARGLSIFEAARVMDRPYSSVATKASVLKISFHGPSGAPPLNRNNRRWRIRMAVKDALRETPNKHE